MEAPILPPRTAFSIYLIFKLQLVFTCHISMLFSLPSCITSGILIYPSILPLSLGYIRQRSSHFSVYKYSYITRMNKKRAFISIYLPLPFLCHKGQTREISFYIIYLIFHPRRFYLSPLSFISRSASTLQCQLISGGLGQPCLIGTQEPPSQPLKEMFGKYPNKPYRFDIDR